MSVQDPETAAGEVVKAIRVLQSVLGAYMEAESRKNSTAVGVYASKAIAAFRTIEQHLPDLEPDLRADLEPLFLGLKGAVSEVGIALSGTGPLPDPLVGGPSTEDLVAKVRQAQTKNLGDQ